MTLGNRPPLVVCLEALEPYIRVIWGAQFMTPSFAQHTPEDVKVFALERDICLGLLPEIVVVKSAWLTLVEFAVSQVAEMETHLARLALGHPRLSLDTPRTDIVSILRASLDLLSPVHPLMVSPFLAPATDW